MQILFLTSNELCPEHYSGPNRTLLELCQRLTEIGHHPLVLARKPSVPGQAEIVVDSTNPYKVFRATNPFKTITPLSLSLRPDIVIIMDGDIAHWISVCRPLNLPLAVWFFDISPHYLFSEQPSDDILFLTSSPFLARRARSLFALETEVIAPFIDRSRYEKKHQGKKVLFVNPMREKGVEIAFQIAGKRPGHRFIFLESWGIPEQWRTHCFGHAIRCGNIEWVSATSDMNSILSQTHLLLIPRFHEEGFCRLVTEAQLGGIPVLASERGYLPENVGKGGTIVPIDSELEKWLAAFDKFYDDTAYYQQMSEQAKINGLRNELNGDVIIDLLLTLLASQISKHGIIRRFAR